MARRDEKHLRGIRHGACKIISPADQAAVAVHLELARRARRNRCTGDDIDRAARIGAAGGHG